MQALHVFKYLEKHNVNGLAFSTCYQCVTSDQDIQGKSQAMKSLYVDSGEEITPNALKPRGKPVQVNYFVTSDHVVDRETR